MAALAARLSIGRDSQHPALGANTRRAVIAIVSATVSGALMDGATFRSRKEATEWERRAAMNGRVCSFEHKQAQVVEVRSCTWPTDLIGRRGCKRRTRRANNGRLHASKEPSWPQLAASTSEIVTQPAPFYCERSGISPIRLLGAIARRPQIPSAARLGPRTDNDTQIGIAQIDRLAQPDDGRNLLAPPRVTWRDASALLGA